MRYKAIKKPPPATAKPTTSPTNLRKYERNALANVIGQLLKFLTTRSRSNYHIERLFPDITPEEKHTYYIAVKHQRERLYGYVSKQQLLEFWHEASPANIQH